MLNASKTKNMLFSNMKKVTQTLPTITTTHRLPVEFVMYKYLGIVIDKDV